MLLAINLLVYLPWEKKKNNKKTQQENPKIKPKQTNNQTKKNPTNKMNSIIVACRIISEKTPPGKPTLLSVRSRYEGYEITFVKFSQ